ncbi:MAG: aldose 1-epimerase family protein [Planctomycetaceae bacterium]
MAKKTWTLTDASQNLEHAEFSIGPNDVEGNATGWSVKKRTLSAGRSAGVSVIEVDNGLFRFSIIPTRGMGIWKGWIGDDMLGWKSPANGPVHPNFVPLSEPSGLGWLDGFDELLVRCGLESNGAPEFDEHHVLKYPLHGRIANLPAHKVTVTVDGDSGGISVTGEVDESRFHFQKLRLTATISTGLNESGFQIHDEVRNLSASPAEVQMLYHTNFGSPQLDAGSKLVVPAKTIVPRNDHAAKSVANWADYQAEQPGFEEQVYFFELLADHKDNTEVLLKNAHGNSGVSLTFNRKQLPWFTQWKNTTALVDGYVTGIEPATNFPNPRNFERKQGRVVKLPAGGSQVFELGVAWHRDAASVANSEKRISQLQGSTKPEIHRSPQSGWCEGA